MAGFHVRVTKGIVPKLTHAGFTKAFSKFGTLEGLHKPPYTGVPGEDYIEVSFKKKAHAERCRIALETTGIEVDGVIVGCMDPLGFIGHKPVQGSIVTADFETLVSALNAGRGSTKNSQSPQSAPVRSQKKESVLANSRVAGTDRSHSQLQVSARNQSLLQRSRNGTLNFGNPIPSPRYGGTPPKVSGLVPEGDGIRGTQQLLARLSPGNGGGRFLNREQLAAGFSIFGEWDSNDLDGLLSILAEGNSDRANTPLAEGAAEACGSSENTLAAGQIDVEALASWLVADSNDEDLLQLLSECFDHAFVPVQT